MDLFRKCLEPVEKVLRHIHIRIPAVNSFTNSLLLILK